MTSSLLNEIKIEIRSLLISSQNGLRENELCRDYSLFNCQRSLPYQIFGYSTVTDFLNSLTDILYRSSDGYIHPIVDQSTKHIHKFVQQQRTNKKKKTKQIPIVNNQHKSIQLLKSSTSRNKQKRAVPSMITSSQQIPRTVDAIKPCPLKKQMKMIHENKVTKESLSRLTPTIDDFTPKFERIHITNDLLQSLLLHFRQQQRQ